MAPASKSSFRRNSPPSRPIRPLSFLALVVVALLVLTATLPRAAHASTSALPSTNMMDRILIAVRNHLNTPVGPLPPAGSSPAVVRATQTVTHTRTYTRTIVATPTYVARANNDDNDDDVAGSAASSPAPASDYAPPFDVASLLDARVQFAARAAPAVESADEEEVVLKSEDAISLTEWPLHVAAAIMHKPQSKTVVKRSWDEERVPARDRSAEVALELMAMVAMGAEEVLADARRYALLESRAW
ncbi:hypothetical protein AMAG_10019 [Allomyces macrogynus ATCC 38327]|uniref:Uncharacterized protein n=1 Tax=Allomyces macrogynus (strain ATCC 38327) TaxID=578462 RepID=A0A0L0SQL0_ALLM3|nr:hypothetical protein AMAG_10019 [Allomyces macrogynus ATCC 38327]|eukprot:KNE64664.1 hypothetical protein AMAG_10019 [Allomyces macrogynus ATCC 38327]